MEIRISRSCKHDCLEKLKMYSSSLLDLIWNALSHSLPRGIGYSSQLLFSQNWKAAANKPNVDDKEMGPQLGLRQLHCTFRL